MKRLMSLVSGTVLLFLMLAPIGAQAAIANLTVTNGVLTYRADTGEANDVSISSDASDTFTVTDSAGFTAGSGCTKVDATRATCSVAISNISVMTGDLADSVNITALRPSTILGGSGSDDLFSEWGTNEMYGQGGADILTGGSGGGNNVLLGGAGNDELHGGPGGDRLDGGTGADVLDGGSGPTDVVSYVLRTQPVSVTWDGQANDGEAGEGDDVSNVEDIIGGSGNDTLVGSKPGKVYGEAGNDHLSFNAPLQGTLLGGPGNDTLTSAGGVALRGNQGNDTLHSANGLNDWDLCAAGDDTVTADAMDSVAADCEHVTIGGSP